MDRFAQQHATIDALSHKQLFFIGGSMKSGTTWLRLLLDAHPEIICGGEAHLMDHFGPLLLELLAKRKDYLADKNRLFGELGGFPTPTPDDLTYMLSASLYLALGSAGVPHSVRAVGEKTPDNIRYFDVLHAVFPAARFIHLVRDGRDCAVSGWFHNLRASPEWTRTHFATLADYTAAFAREWTKDLSVGQEFAAAHPDATLTLRYEDLIEAPEALLAQVAAFLGADPAADLVGACCAQARFETLTNGRPRGVEDPASFLRKAAPGDWRNHLDAVAEDTFMTTAGDAMRAFAYA